MKEIYKLEIYKSRSEPERVTDVRYFDNLGVAIMYAAGCCDWPRVEGVWYKCDDIEMKESRLVVGDCVITRAPIEGGDE